MKLNPNTAARERQESQRETVSLRSLHCCPSEPASAARILDCGGRAQRRHRFSGARTPAKAAWRFASRRSPKEFACGLVALRSLAAIALSFLFAGAVAQAQVNTGSDGHDGAFNPTTDTAINLADHPDGIAYCTSATTFSPMSASAGRPFRTRDLLCCPLVPTFPP